MNVGMAASIAREAGSLCPELREDLPALLAELCREFQVPGAATGVWHAGDQAIACNGVTSTADPLPVDPHTLFMIGSTSKTFTATALMTRVQAGDVALDDLVVELLPDLVLADETALEVLTVGQLLDHTAGWVGDGEADTGYGDDALAIAVKNLVSKAEQITSPGAQMSYNNGAFLLAGRLLEVLTGKPYDAALRQLVLEPLELRETWLNPWDVVHRRMAVGHASQGTDSIPQLGWLSSRAGAPAGGVASTVGDQLRYAAFHLRGGALLNDSTRRLMQQPRITVPSALSGVGISWLLRDYGEVRLVEHGGNLANIQLSTFTLVPSMDLAVTTLTNSVGGREVGRRLLEYVLDRAGIRKPQPLPPRPPDPRVAQELAGRYDAGQWWLDVTSDDTGRLFIQTRLHDIPGLSEEVRATFERPPTELVLVADDVVASADDTRITAGDFVRNAHGDVAYLRFGLRLTKKVPRAGR
jgi:CubicO group peptidase (beta-lactamase class C family)